MTRNGTKKSGNLVITKKTDNRDRELIEKLEYRKNSEMSGKRTGIRIKMITGEYATGRESRSFVVKNGLEGFFLKSADRNETHFLVDYVPRKVFTPRSQNHFQKKSSKVAWL